ncbi:nucleoside hydrolase [Zavarzinia sp. CC-PAN008]|uniref:nucleoside hydrolase n=1 Tax=Zavarzinia sp. CC-PAN008 TaxID=3243332 RepID=UPI003F742F20
MSLWTLAPAPAALAEDMAPAAAPQRWIVDTDLALDDTIALLLMTRAADVQIGAVTLAASGATRCNPGVEQLSRLLVLAGGPVAGVPIGCGYDLGLDGYAVYPDEWRRPRIDYPGFDLPQAEHREAAGAPELILRALRESHEPVSILALGPLTNLAVAFTLEPMLKEKVKRIVVMGGALSVPGNVQVAGTTDHLTNRVAEWNFYLDPVAARLVFETGVPITLVPLDATNRLPLTAGFADRLAEQAASDPARYVAAMLKANRGLLVSGQFRFWDPLAALVALDPGLCTTEVRSILVNADPASDGTPPPTGLPLARVDGQPRRVLDPDRAGQTAIDPQGRTVDVCLSVPLDEVEARIIQGLNRGG